MVRYVDLVAPADETRPLSRGLTFFGCILFRGNGRKSIETGEARVLLLYKATVFHGLGWRRSLFRFWLYQCVITVQAFLGLIVNVQAGLQ